ncbi:MAG: hypothetical protein GF315_00295, partial [candidate division Zixibacteria bacterium]|nr:hypothetical protein [candidate division Zixibacteria bacterium]
MSKSQGWKIGLILALFIIAVYYIYPSIVYHTMSYEEKMAMQEDDPVGYAKLQNGALKLGLDLQGGMHMVLEVDKSQLTSEEAKDASERVLQIVRNRIDQWGVSEPQIYPQGDDRVVVELPGLRETERAKELIGRTAILEFKLVEDPQTTDAALNAIDSVLSERLKAEDAKPEEAIEEILPDTAESELPDAADLFAESEEGEELQDIDLDDYYVERPFTSLMDIEGGSILVPDDEYPLVNKYLNDPAVQEVIPEEMEFTWSTRTFTKGSMEYHELYALKGRVEMSGKYLTDARPNWDQFRKPVVNFTLTKDGGRIFAGVTGANIGKRLAITLDGRVESAPEIRAK